MKRYLFFILHITICSCTLSNAQGIVFNSIKKSETKWDELIELNSGANPSLILQKMKVESSNDIIVRGTTLLQMSDAIIKCRRFVLDGSIRSIESNGSVTIDCVDIEFQASNIAPPVPDINVKRWNSSTGKLIINYTGAFINNRRLIFSDAEAVQINFVNTKRK